MSAEIKVPAVGESISSGIISLWHRQDGDYVRAGDLLFTLDTDKVSTEVAAQAAGVVRIKAPADTEVKIGEVVGLIEEAPEPAAAPVAPVPAAAPVVSPAAAPAPAPPAPAPATPVELEPQERRVTRKKLSPLRKKISTQLVAAQRNAAILTTFNECDMAAVMKLRADVQETFQAKHGIKLGFMSFFIKAVVDALKSEPQINSRLDGDELVQNHFYDIGVAVGTERGLIVPVIRDADRKTFAELENDLAYYAKRAREGAITIEDLQGGVFTISNGGVYGSLLSTPILNPPQSGILGMHKIQERPVAVEGRVVIRPMMYLALSYDHRVVDGREAVTFLVRVKEAIENPLRLFPREPKMKRAAAAFLFALVSLGSAPGQEAAPDPAVDPLVLQRRLAMVLRQSTQHYEAGEYDTALERLGAIKGPAAEDLSVLNLRGAILTKLGRYDEASESFRAILSAQPDFFPAAFNLGEVEFIRGDYADALELFGDMRRREPRNELVRFKILLCQLLLGLDEDAQKTARGLVPAGSTPAWYYAQAMLARKAGDEASARKHLDAAKAIYEAEGCKLFDESIAPVKF